MMPTAVVDASALAAVVFQEPRFERVAAQLEGRSVVAPLLLQFELANVAVMKARRDPAQAPAILGALAVALDDSTGIQWRAVNPTDVALLACITGLTAYDASYLWLAGSEEADLVTLDEMLMAAAATEADALG